MFRILVVEDDPDLGRLFVKVLERAGYTAILSPSGEDALQKIEDEKVDLMLTDVMMPGMDGFTLTREARDLIPGLPVMVITARSAFLDKQAGFASGADDYMVKPVDVNEMVLRVGALLRRAKGGLGQTLTIGSTTLDFASLGVTVGNRVTDLPQKEFLLLFKLLAAPGRIFTRQQIMDDIWGVDSASETHTVDVHINRLRDRFRDNPDFEIVTVRGLGYKAVKK
ncbi:MAG: response regulator transcription factor [Clostridia bacterium]|nr:response regulator transcription factor [Oscillospiraceae bacterium]MBQ2750853.1 response regulator transcription factor [Clostridia bacterium]